MQKPILLNGRANQNKIDAHIMTSAQGRENAFSKLAKNAVNKEITGIPSILYAQKKAEQMLNTEGVQFPNRYAFDSVNHNIHDVGLKVKPQTETLQFKNWFSKSKVVDSSGKPLVVYHGSSAVFTVFDHRFGYRNGAAEGRGFYFTSDRNKANGYKTEDGKLFEVYLSLQKPLDPDALTITKTEVEKIIRAIDTDGIGAAVKKRGVSRQSLFDAQSIVENSYPVGYEYADLRHLKKIKTSTVNLFMCL